MRSQQVKILLVVAALAALAIIVPNTNSFVILLATRALAFAILVMSLDILLGYTGLAFSGSLILSTLSIATVGAGFYMFHTTVQIHITQVAPEARGSAVALFATFLFLGNTLYP